MRTKIIVLTPFLATSVALALVMLAAMRASQRARRGRTSDASCFAKRATAMEIKATARPCGLRFVRRFVRCFSPRRLKIGHR